MRRSEIIEILKGHRAELAALGVDHLCLFGSVARDEALADSDVDVVVDTVDGQPLGLFRLARIAETLESLLARRVDVILKSGLTHTNLGRQGDAGTCTCFLSIGCIRARKGIEAWRKRGKSVIWSSRCSMLEVPATEIAKRFSQYCQAAQREPVAVTHHRRVTEVLVSKRDYDEYVRLKSMATRSLWLHELSADSLAALAEARVDPRHDHLDALLVE